MASSDKEFKHESYQDRDTILEYLKSITEGIEKGAISLGNQRERVELEPDGLLKFKIEAKRKADRSKLSLQVSWKHDSRKPAFKPQEFTISTDSESRR